MCEGSGESGGGGVVEGDGDGVGGVGEVAVEVEQVAGGRAVFVGVLQVVVEPVGEPVLGVEGQQAQQHLQGAAAGAGAGALRVGVEGVRGQFRGVGVELGLRGGEGVGGGGDAGLRGGDGLVDRGVVLVGAQELGQGAFGGGQFVLGGGEGFPRGGAGRVGYRGGVGAEVGAVVAQRVDAVVGGEVLEHVLDPPAAAQPGQQRRRGGGGVAGEDLHDRPVVFE